MADQIKAVFLAALETLTDQRPAYLERACGGDAGVRRRVEALLRAHEGPDRLLDRPAWRPTPELDAPATLAAGALLRRCRRPGPGTRGAGRSGFPRPPGRWP